MLFVEGEDDPSTHPTVRPTFMERSRSEMKRMLSVKQGSQKRLFPVKDNRRSFYVLDTDVHALCTLKKSNSCSTIFLDDSTISQPNLKNTIKCISLAIYYHIANRKNRYHERLMEIFEERLHPISVGSPLPTYGHERCRLARTDFDRELLARPGPPSDLPVHPHSVLSGSAYR